MPESLSWVLARLIWSQNQLLEWVIAFGRRLWLSSSPSLHSDTWSSSYLAVLQAETCSWWAPGSHGQALPCLLLGGVTASPQPCVADVCHLLLQEVQLGCDLSTGTSPRQSGTLVVTGFLQDLVFQVCIVLGFLTMSHWDVWTVDFYNEVTCGQIYLKQKIHLI